LFVPFLWREKVGTNPQTIFMHASRLTGLLLIHAGQNELQS
jgi:hypothetical protein